MYYKCMNTIEINIQSDISAWQFDAIFILFDQNLAAYIRLQALVNWVRALLVTSKPPKVDLSLTYTVWFSWKSIKTHNLLSEMHPWHNISTSTKFCFVLCIKQHTVMFKIQKIPYMIITFLINRYENIIVYKVQLL